jgi:demethylmenaquinone methyltransferase/2-methoxy-6-polyprenyl-1,4-benzoquinol methylase
MDNLKTSFGKRKVTAALKTSLVQEIFTNVVEKYDGMNDFMSLGAHRLWKKELIDLMNIQLTDTIIDVGSGTGDLIDLILNKKKINSIYSIDLNDKMLLYGKKRFKNKNVHFVKANAENLPFKNNFFDKYIVSFCLRNVTDIKKALNEALRILKPGGTFYCLEFSSPKSSLINSIYKSYKKNIIPWIGKKIAENEEAYQYLQESIDQFPSQEELLLNLTQIGFYQTKYLNMFNGIVSVHIGYKI